jgi:hypothetical protein
MPRTVATTLWVHRPATAGFFCVDVQAGYWVGPARVDLIEVETVRDCASAGTGAELRAVDDLWQLVDAVRDRSQLSAIRVRKAAPRPG